MGNAGGACFPIAFPWILELTNKNYSMVFYASAFMYVIAFLSWSMLDSSKSIDTKVNRSQPG
jgi:nitrate/nitrite transporter NarK